MDVTTEAARALSDEALHAALAQVNLGIQRLEEHAKGRDDPAQWHEPDVGVAILEGLHRRRRWREEVELELARRSDARGAPRRVERSGDCAAGAERQSDG